MNLKIVIIIIFMHTQHSVQSAQSYKSVIQTIKGNGVFKARLLHAYFEPGFHYDDIGVCNGMGVYRGTSNPLQHEENLINGKGEIENNEPIIYPNPTTGQITIEFKLKENENGKVKIFDLLGNEVLSINLNNQVSRTVCSLPNLSKGVYIATILLENKCVYNTKLILE
jgi:hypothetical protein